MHSSRSLKREFWGHLLAILLWCVSAGAFAATTVTMSGSPSYSCPPYGNYTLSVTCSISGKTLTCTRTVNGICNFYGSGTGSMTSQILIGGQAYTSVAFSYPTWAGGLHVCATAPSFPSSIRECFIPQPQGDPLYIDYIGLDTDSDYRSNATDNCPTIANQNQLDTDADGIGNVCDPTPNGSPQTITITTAPPANATVNSTFPVAATASSGLIVVITTSGDCTIAAGVVTITSAAIACTVQYNQPGNISWWAAPQVTSITAVDNPGIAQTITVTIPAPLIAPMSGSFPIVASASSGLPVAITLSGGCAITSGIVTLFGTAACTISYRQAGDATYAAASLISSVTAPVLVNPAHVSAGGQHNCVLDNAGVHCWGLNNVGQTTVPVLVNPIHVSASPNNHTCAVDSAGVHCWGNNGFGQLNVPALLNPVKVSAGYFHTCALDSAGVHCWGINSVVNVPALLNPVQISAGGQHACALDNTGVHCWGYNGQGQTSVPVLISPIQVSAGGYHTCALDSTGVHCWGDNYYNQTAVPVLVNPVQISSGYNHTCALDSTGVHCWGYNTSGLAAVPALINPVQISSGYDHSCALDDSGVVCWGRDTYGQAEEVAAQFFADTDHDNVADTTDNCVLIANTTQLNMDGDSVGDACDGDTDGDNIPNGIDSNPVSAVTATEIILPLDATHMGAGFIQRVERR